MSSIQELFDVFDEPEHPPTLVVRSVKPPYEDIRSVDGTSPEQPSSEDCIQQNYVERHIAGNVENLTSHDPDDDKPTSNKRKSGEEALFENKQSQDKKNVQNSKPRDDTDKWFAEIQKNTGELEDAKYCEVRMVNEYDDCLHEVVLPPDFEYHELNTDVKPVKTFPFVLDSFQKEAISCIDNEESVLISAHTSAGKTVAALYSIAKALKNNQRVIYTTPLKALSNQKFREFHEEFEDVGLITGDCTLNSDANCLIMTTEILRNMLYRGSHITREVKWVIFDEIHYMRDPNRGIVWEESLILIPENVRMVFLSATIPNARQFAEWVATIHKQPCHVVYTESRPVPLQHFVYPAGGDGLHLIVDEKGIFRENIFQLVVSELGGGADVDASSVEPTKPKRQKLDSSLGNNVGKVVNMLVQRNMTPIICFSFSKKECELFATNVCQTNIMTEQEQSMTTVIINSALEQLSEEDINLAQITNMKVLLLRGIGVHHGGLIPILKELVEILFSENLLKVLFATETFAMGLNMPAKTVVFTKCEKFDGQRNRILTSGEYIQMSGRAGRRGLDDKGVVVTILTEQLEVSEAKSLFLGKADRLDSAFHLTYNMILNLMRIEGIDPEYMLEKSFRNFQNGALIPGVHKEINEAKRKYASIKVENESEVAQYLSMKESHDASVAIILKTILHPQNVGLYLSHGRVAEAITDENKTVWGLVINEENKKINSLDTFDILVAIRGKDDADNNMKRISITPMRLRSLSSIKLSCDFTKKDGKSIYNALKASKDGEEDEALFMNKNIKRKNGFPLLDPKELKFRPSNYENAVKNKKSLYPMMEALKAKIGNSFASELQLCIEKRKLMQLIDKKMEEINIITGNSLLHELQLRKVVLRSLEYCTEQDILSTKGKIACELSNADELLLTEMIFNGLFQNLDPSECVSLLSIFVCEAKSNSTIQMIITLRERVSTIKKLARNIANVSNRHGISMDEEQYVESIKFYLMDVAHAWCNGSSFSDLCKMTDIFEGSLVRSFRRLEEIIRELVQMSRTIGNKELEEKFVECDDRIRRGIVFACSLYL